LKIQTTELYVKQKSDPDLFLTHNQLGSDSPILVFHGYQQSTLANFFLYHLEALHAIAKDPDVEKLNQMFPKGLTF
jgi:hypothetical protein